jgi:hypothetical protein
MIPCIKFDRPLSWSKHEAKEQIPSPHGNSDSVAWLLQPDNRPSDINEFFTVLGPHGNGNFQNDSKPIGA